MIGIAVGRKEHQLILKNEKGIMQLPPIPNTRQGAEKLIELLKSFSQNEVVFLGNWRWALPLACFLDSRKVKCFYFPMQRGTRGKIGSVLRQMMESNTTPRPFFTEKHFFLPPEGLLPLRLVKEYLTLADEVRAAKHRVEDLMLCIFPELAQRKNLFSPKMKKVLENPDPFFLAVSPEIPYSIKILAQNTLARYIPPPLRKRALQDYQTAYQQLLEALKAKEEKLNEIRRLFASHPIAQMFGGCDTAIIVAAMIGWRKWEWRQLRRFCGLDVTRIDSKGRPRISRSRPYIRQYIYLLTGTKLGREITKNIKGHARVKKIEKLLKYIWQNALKE